MPNYSAYDIFLEDYQKKLPHYLQTPGSIIMNQIQLFYDIMKEYRDLSIDLWGHFNLDALLTEYFIWKSQNPGLDDSEWKYTDLVEKLCKTYDIYREHPVELNPIDFPGEGTVLTNAHMIRLLKIKTMGVGFDGTKEKLEFLLESLFPKQISSVRYVVQTITNGSDHGAANVYLIRSAYDLTFDTIDNALFAGGYYFLHLLGITLNFISVPADTLIYDSTIYDDSTNDGVEDENGNRYDEGGII